MLLHKPSNNIEEGLGNGGSLVWGEIREGTALLSRGAFGAGLCYYFLICSPNLSILVANASLVVL